MAVLVVDVGTSGLRAALVRPDGEVSALEYRTFPPSTPFPGLVEFDPVALADAVVEVARSVIAAAGPVDAVGITNQRASTVVWDADTGEPVGPGLGWQDLRTVVACLTARAEHGLHLAPNQSATKIAWLLDQVDPGRTRRLRAGTLDTWLVAALSGGAHHVTDRSNAAVTGLLRADGSTWDEAACDALHIPIDMLADLVDTIGVLGTAEVLPGAPPIAALVGDQQASLVGQGCVRPGRAKITFGTGGMLDVCTDRRPAFTGRGPAGTFPIVAWTRDGALTWGAEGVMLSAGSNVEWLVDDLGILTDPADSHTVAARCDDTGGVVYVPALLGLGTPWWDYGARGTLLGITRGTGRPEIVRAVLEGVAHRGADLVDAAEADTGLSIPVLRVDGGMSANPTFVQALADASARPVEVSRHTEATTVGAAYLAGLAVGIWGSFDEVEALARPGITVDPRRPADRARWAAAVDRARTWIPDLSALNF